MSQRSGDVVDAIRRLAREEIADFAASIDRGRTWPTGNLKALADAGALGLVVPEASGGSGASLTDLAAACEALGAACASTGMIFLMHAVTAATIAAGGGVRSAEALRNMAVDGALGSLAFSERGTGAHFYSPELSLERSNGVARVTGRKSFVTSGGHADYYLLLLQAEAEGKADIFMATGDLPGIAFEGSWDGLGMTANNSVEMQLQGVALDDTARIGGPGQGLDLVFSVVAPFFLIGLASVNVGIASAAATEALDNAANRRYPDGSSLADLQFIQHCIADMDHEVRSARLLVQEAARLADAEDEGALVPIMESKIVATETAATVARRALEVTGGRGYSQRLPTGRHLRDALAGSVMAPTNAVLRTWIGKALAGLPVP